MTDEIVPYSDNTRGVIAHNMPERLLQSFRLAITDPNILEVSDDIALLIARRDDLLSRLADDSFGPGLWKELLKTFDRFKEARRAASRGSTRAAEKMAEELENLENLIAKGYYEDLLWAELKDLLEQRRRLVGTEIRRRERAEEVITRDQFKSLLGYVINSVQTRVKNKDEVMAVLADIQNLQF